MGLLINFDDNTMTVKCDICGRVMYEDKIYKEVPKPILCEDCLDLIATTYRGYLKLTPIEKFKECAKPESDLEERVENLEKQVKFLMNCKTEELQKSLNPLLPLILL